MSAPTAHQSDSSDITTTIQQPENKSSQPSIPQKMTPGGEDVSEIQHAQSTTAASGDENPDSDEQVTPQLVDFPKFSKLPLEVQDLIWIAALPSRLVSMQQARISFTWHSPSLPPAILHTCQRSREIALLYGPTEINIILNQEKTDKYHLPGKSYDSELDGGDPRRGENWFEYSTGMESVEVKTFFDFKRDIMCFDFTACYPENFELIQEHMDRIEHIAIGEIDDHGSWPEIWDDDEKLLRIEENYSKFLPGFPNLKSLTLVAEQPYAYQPELYQLGVPTTTNPSVNDIKLTLRDLAKDIRKKTLSWLAENPGSTTPQRPLFLDNIHTLVRSHQTATTGFHESRGRQVAQKNLSNQIQIIRSKMACCKTDAVAIVTEACRNHGTGFYHTPVNTVDEFEWWKDSMEPLLSPAGKAKLKDTTFYNRCAHGWYTIDYRGWYHKGEDRAACGSHCMALEDMLPIHSTPDLQDALLSDQMYFKRLCPHRKHLFTLYWERVTAYDEKFHNDVLANGHEIISSDEDESDEDESDGDESGEEEGGSDEDEEEDGSDEDEEDEVESDEEDEEEEEEEEEETAPMMYSDLL